MPTPVKKRKWYEDAKDAAPIPFYLGAIVGASWPFTSIFVISLFATGANVFELGQQGNWADDILAVCAAASFGGPVTLVVLILAMIGGYQVGGWVCARLCLKLPDHKES